MLYLVTKIESESKFTNGKIRVIAANKFSASDVEFMVKNDGYIKVDADSKDEAIAKFETKKTTTKITGHQLFDTIQASYNDDSVKRLSDGLITIELDFWGEECKIEFYWNEISGKSVEIKAEDVSVYECEKMVESAYSRRATELAFEIYEYWIPSHYESYLVNGVADNLDDDEIKAADLFCDGLPGMGHFSFVRNLGYKPGNMSDIDPSQTLDCDMVLYEFLVKKGSN